MAQFDKSQLIEFRDMLVTIRDKVSTLWNDSLFAEVGEETCEHVLRIDAVVETSPARLDGACDVVVLHETKNGVGEGPRRDLLVGEWLQLMFTDNRLPNRLLVGHVDGERRRDWIGHRHVEHRGDARPEVSPTEVVAVGNVEDLVLGRLGLAGPRRRLGENFCRGNLIQDPIRLLRARKPQWEAELL